MAVIECTDVKKTYRTGLRGRVNALNGVDLEVKEGEIFGLLGPNGAGKTTLVKIILNLVHPTDGNVKLLGSDVGDHRIRSRIGYLPENPNLPPYLKGGQAMELFGNLSGLDPRTCKERSDELLKEVKMDQWVNKKTSTYSKGMIQRLGLAQALMNDPDVLFLDEPTDGVDPIGRREIREVLKGLKKQGKTIFLNSHLLSETEMLCDHVAIMEKGKMVAMGSLDELTKTSNYYKIKCDKVDDEILEKLKPLISVKYSINGIFEAKIDDVKTLNEVIDVLRSSGQLIESVTPVRQSLESYFIDLIKDVRGEENGK
ncbi:MAG: ABC transporter ATP-binding protein [bacterium]|nr:ABC transporter ATP-binding protein [bacterium]